MGSVPRHDAPEVARKSHQALKMRGIEMALGVLDKLAVFLWAPLPEIFPALAFFLPIPKFSRYLSGAMYGRFIWFSR